jgi:hypothetical protein
MGGGGPPIQDGATWREMGGSGRPAGRAVDGGERWQCRAVVQSGGRGGADWGGPVLRGPHGPIVLAGLKE